MCVHVCVCVCVWNTLMCVVGVHPRRKTVVTFDVASGERVNKFTVMSANAACLRPFPDGVSASLLTPCAGHHCCVCVRVCVCLPSCLCVCVCVGTDARGGILG